MAVSSAKGDERAKEAAEQAISSQLLDITIDGARGILLNVTGGPDLTLFEVNQAAAIIKETAHPDVNLIFGAVIDQNMKDQIRITVIATGFERTSPPRSVINTVAPRQETRPAPRTGQAPTESREVREFAQAAVSRTQQAPQQPRQPDFPTYTLNTEDLDIPAFMRKRAK